MTFQAGSMRHFCYLYLVVLSWFLFIPNTHELQAAQTQALFQLRVYLEYPSSLQIWENYNWDLCSISPSANLSIKCDKIHRFSSLQVLDLSSNFIFGAIPQKLSTMVKLHALTLDDNYFNTTMPDWFDSLSNLNILSVKSNGLKGSFPSSLCKIKTLEVISLSHNELSGELPDLGSLTGLHVLDLRENHLESELPLFPKSVVTVLLSNNSFSGDIPKQFGELDQLQHLDLSSNHLSKTPPSTLFSSPKISYLNLANNVLSGALQDKLSCGGKLGFVDISSNKLSGGLPSCLANTTDGRVVRYAGNCLSLNSQNQNSGSYCRESSSGWKNLKKWKVAAAMAIIVGLVLVVLVSGVFLWKKYHSRKKTGQEVLLKIVHDNSTTGVPSEILANASKYILGLSGVYLILQILIGYAIF